MDTVTHQAMTEPTVEALDFAELLERYDYQPPRRGQYLEGQVVHMRDDTLFLDVGGKRTAIVSTAEMRDLDAHLLSEIAQGDRLPLYVKRTPVGDEALEVSLRRGLEKQDWDHAAELLASGEITAHPVVGYNKGGLLVGFGRIQGFVPNSHIPNYDFRNGQSHKARLQGEDLPLKVIEIDQDRKRLVLSGRAAAETQRRERLEALAVGDVVPGTVSNLAGFGAFVDIGGGVTGMIHISKIDWQPVNHPSDILSPGDSVEVRIDSVDVERERVSLNRKALLPDPWDLVGQRYDIGDRVEGVVTNVVDFGVFVRLPEGVEGLVHVSELNPWQAADPQGALQQGDIVLAAVVDIDVMEERIGLSLKRVAYEEELAWIQRREQPDIVA